MGKYFYRTDLFKLAMEKDRKSHILRNTLIGAGTLAGAYVAGQQGWLGQTGKEVTDLVKTKAQQIDSTLSAKVRKLNDAAQTDTERIQAQQVLKKLKHRLQIGKDVTDIVKTKAQQIGSEISTKAKELKNTIKNPPYRHGLQKDYNFFGGTKM